MLSRVNYSKDDLKKTVKNDGGHNILRGITNILYANNWSRLLASTRSKDRPVVVYSLGAKFMKEANFLKRYSDCRIIYKPIRPCMVKYDKTYYRDHENNYADLVRSQKGSGWYKSRQEIDKEIVQLGRKITSEQDPAVRDRLVKEVKTLHLKRQCIGPSVEFCSPFVGTVQEFESLENDEFEGYERIYILNDVHYYLAGWKPKFDGMVYVSGAQFSTVLGSPILLPFGQGWYNHCADLSSEGSMVPTKIIMNTSRTNHTYEHPWVWVSDVEQSVKYGWYEHFSTV